MMDMDMMGGLGTMMLIGLLLLAIVIGVAVYLGIRATQTREPREPRQLTARERLQHRLADGEITPTSTTNAKPSYATTNEPDTNGADAPPAQQHRSLGTVVTPDQETRAARLVRRTRRRPLHDTKLGLRVASG